MCLGQEHLLFTFPLHTSALILSLFMQPSNTLLSMMVKVKIWQLSDFWVIFLIYISSQDLSFFNFGRLNSILPKSLLLVMFGLLVGDQLSKHCRMCDGIHYIEEDSKLVVACCVLFCLFQSITRYIHCVGSRRWI